MVRILSTKQFRDGDGEYQYIEAAGLSTDSKPVMANMATGSTFIEVNTGKVYMWNEASTTWVEFGG